MVVLLFFASMPVVGGAPANNYGSKSGSALFIFSPQHAAWHLRPAHADSLLSVDELCRPSSAARLPSSPALGGKGRRRGHALLYTQIMETLAANGDGQAEARRATHFRQRWRLSMESLVRG